MTVDKTLGIQWEKVLEGIGTVAVKDNILYSIEANSPTMTDGIPAKAGDMIQADTGQTVWAKAEKWTAEIAVMAGV